jgi:hypothetical protein
VSGVRIDFWGFVAFVANSNEAKEATAMTAVLPRAEKCWGHTPTPEHLECHDAVLIVSVKNFKRSADPDVVIVGPDGEQYGVWHLGKPETTLLRFDAGAKRRSDDLRVSNTITRIPELRTVLGNKAEGRVDQGWLTPGPNSPTACVIDLGFGRIRPGPVIKNEDGTETKWVFQPKSRWSQLLAEIATWSFEAAKGLTVTLVEGKKTRILDLAGDEIHMTVSNLPPHIPGGAGSKSKVSEVIHHFAGYYDLLCPVVGDPNNSHIKPGDRPLPTSGLIEGVTPRRCTQATLWNNSATACIVTA